MRGIRIILKVSLIALALISNPSHAQDIKQFDGALSVMKYYFEGNEKRVASIAENSGCFFEVTGYTCRLKDGFRAHIFGAGKGKLNGISLRQEFDDSSTALRIYGELKGDILKRYSPEQWEKRESVDSKSYQDGTGSTKCYRNEGAREYSSYYKRISGQRYNVRLSGGGKKEDKCYEFGNITHSASYPAIVSIEVSLE